MATKTFRAAIAAICVAAALPSYVVAGTATIGFAGYKGTETLTDFPALIKLPLAADGFAYADAAANGADIFFTDSGGNVLSHEIDHWNADGASYIWVKVPTLTATTTITMHWGEALPADLPAATTTWSGYVGVWHMNAANGSTSTAEPDSTGNGLFAAPTRNTKSGVANRLAELRGMAAGKVGPARQNQGVNGSFNCLKTGNYYGKITDCSKMTIGGWFRATAATGWMRLFSAKNANSNGYGFEAFTVNGSSTSFGASGSSSHSSTSNTTFPDVIQNWVHAQIVYDGTTATYYVNGVAKNSFTVTAIKPNGNALYLAIGNDIDPDEAGWCGFYDEVRMYDGVLSADRIQAEYDTANDPLVFTRGHTADLYCSGYTGTEPLVNFPVYVTVPDCVPSFKYEDAAADGSDIWFSDATGNVLASEMDTWKISGHSAFWVKIPSMTGDTRITMHWGGTPPASRPAATEVWTGYAGVWHMGTADGANGISEPDATGHGLNAAPTSAVASALSQIKPRGTGNRPLLGLCCQNQGNPSTKYKLGLKVPSPEPYMTDMTKMSIGGWFYADGVNAYMRLFSAKSSNGHDGGWEVWTQNNTAAKFGVTGGTKSKNINPSETTYDCLSRWLHFMAVYNGTNVKLYVNGEKYIDGTVGAITARAADAATGDEGGYSFMIGGMPRLNDASWNGCFDEVRMYDGAMSEERVKTLYLAESSPTVFLGRKPRSASGIVEEQPYYRLTFEADYGTYNRCLWGTGVQLLPYAAITSLATKPSLEGSAGSTAITASSSNVAGQGFNFGSGDWTYHVRARTGDVTNGVVWCLGGDPYEIVLAANGPDGVSLAVLQKNVAAPLARLDVSVPHASVSYHDYAAVFHVSGKTVDFYVDGVFKDSVSYANFTASDDRWKFFGLWTANVNFTYTKDARIEEMRFFQRALTAAELATLHNWLSFGAPARNVYSATVSEDCVFDALEWTPEPPDGGFGVDDVLDITFTAEGKVLSLISPSLPAVAGITVRGCAGAAAGSAGTVRAKYAQMTGSKWLKLENGAMFDENGLAQPLSAFPRLVLGDSSGIRNEGGALNYGYAQSPRGLELEPGATAYLHAKSTMGLIGHSYGQTFTDLNGGVLAKTGSAVCFVANTVFGGGGTFEVREGTVETYKTASAYGTTVLDVKPGATFNSAVDVTIGTVKGAGNLNSTSGILTVGDELSGLLTVGGTTNTVFASGATLNLSENASPFMQPSTMTFAGTVNIVLPDGAHGKTKLIAWNEPPADGVTFAAVGGLPQGMKLDTRSDGLYLVRPGMIIIIK